MTAPQPAKPERTAAAALLLGKIDRRRVKLHARHTADTVPLVATLAASVTGEQLVISMSGSTDRATGTTAAHDELRHRLQITDGLAASWMTATSLARADARSEGIGAATWIVAPDDATLARKVALAAVDIDPRWEAAAASVDQQLAGLAGDLAATYVSAIGDAVAADDLQALLTSTLMAGAGAEAYLDDMISSEYTLGALDAYAQAQLEAMDWVTMGDGAVDTICLDYEQASPYGPASLPMCPAHMRCRCFIAPAGTVSLTDITFTLAA